RFGEPSGSNAEDETTNNLDATYNNGVTLAAAGALAGDSDTSARFDGSDDDAQLSNSALNTDSFSVEFFVNPDQLRVQNIVTTSSYANSWRIRMSDTSGHLEFDGVADAYNCVTSGND